MKLLAQVPIEEARSNVRPAKKCRDIPRHAEDEEEKGRVEGASACLCQYDTPSEGILILVDSQVFDELPDTESELHADDETDEGDLGTMHSPVGAYSAPTCQALEIALFIFLLLLSLLQTGNLPLLDEAGKVVAGDARALVGLAHHAPQKLMTDLVIVRVVVAGDDIVFLGFRGELIVGLVQLALDFGVVNVAVAIVV